MTIPDTQQPAVLVIGPGSKEGEEGDECLRLTEQLGRLLPGRLYASAFLELPRPTLREGLTELMRQGAREITVLPGLLMAAERTALAGELNAFQAANPGLKIACAAELGVHAGLLRAARERLESAEPAFGPDYKRQETLLLVAGEGVVDATLGKITRLLWEGMGFGWAATGYGEAARPSLGESLERVQRLGFGQMIVFPWLLFTGRRLGRVYAAADAFQARHPELEVVKAPPLGPHPQVLEAFLERLHEAEHGDGRSNCQFCPYRRST